MAFHIVVLLLFAAISPDQYELARMIDGEAVACVDEWCFDAAIALLDTVYNRLDAGWCGSVKGCLEDAYWGYHVAPEIPSNWAIEAVRGYNRKNKDIVFAFSDLDCVNLDIDRDLALVRAGPFHFYDNGIDLNGQ